MKVLILGVTGLIGSTLSRTLVLDEKIQVIGTTRKLKFNSSLVGLHDEQIYKNINISNIDCVVELLERVRPSIVINCAGITKHIHEADNPIVVLPINSIFPHRLGKLCTLVGARLIHISSDCVFSGDSGSYGEFSNTDARDLYGKSKSLGEVINQVNCVTLRTSTIGHEIETKYGLLEWFLNQKNECNGFSRAIFSGLTTLELARVIKNHVIPNQTISGLYNVAAEPITKYDLLCLISKIYRKDTNLILNEEFVINRSLSPKKFFDLTGYIAPKWTTMINDMYEARPHV
ncbi:SDR family oxidoreductase [Polynucleobacter paneuropaeus]|nr:SDR family oxidoreductase [Polynucleobacter paneuropaeus]